MTKNVVKDMLSNLVHIGNKTSFWSPKMRQYIYGSASGVHILNLDKTEAKLEEVKKELAELTKQGKTILFVSTKVQARETVVKLVTETGHPYVNEKWVPGLLTNFRTIKRRIGTYQKFLADAEKGSFEGLTKKERAAQMLELSKLDKAYKGLKDLQRLPDAVFVVDGKYEEQAVKEAHKLHIPVYALLNTNGDIDSVTNFIPVNTNSFKSIKFVLEYLKEAIAAPKKQNPQQQNNNAGVRKMVQRPEKTMLVKEEKTEVKKEESKKEVVEKKEKAPAKKTTKTAKKEEKAE